MFNFLDELGLDEPALTNGATVSASGLSAREVEVLRLIAAGKRNREIAHDLVISDSTVAKHVSSILAKTDAGNRAEATTFAHTITSFKARPITISYQPQALDLPFAAERLIILPMRPHTPGPHSRCDDHT